MNFIHLKYASKAYIYLPITFIKRVLLGKNSHLKRYFWEKWGFIEKDIFQKLHKTHLIWINTCSGGEVLQAVTFSKLIREKYPSINICLSTESNDVYHFAKTIPTIDFVFNSPWDLKGPVKRTLKKLKPIILIAIDFTMQPVLFREAHNLGIKTILLSGKMSDNFDKAEEFSRSLSLKYYNFFDVIGVKTLKDLEGYKQLGVPQNKIVITGDMKYDNYYNAITTEEKNSLAKQLHLTGPGKVFLSELDWDEEEMIFFAYENVKKHIPNLKFILVLRYIEQFPPMEQYIKKKNLSYAKMSDLMIKYKNTENFDILIVDVFGKLPFLYWLADYVFLGGSMKQVPCYGHNPIEALLCGKPILFGPSMERWQDITIKLKKIWKNCEVQNGQQLFESIMALHHNKELRESLQKTAKEITTLDIDPIQENFILFKTAYSQLHCKSSRIS